METYFCSITHEISKPLHALAVSFFGSWLTSTPFSINAGTTESSTILSVACDPDDSINLTLIYDQIVTGSSCPEYPNSPLSWNFNTPVCGWDGVDLDPITGNVIALDLSGKALTGSIPSEIGNLSNLVSLQMTNNCLSGIIPTELEQLNELEVLYLDNNQLNGPIPDALCNLSNLVVLFLDNNTLTGTVPECFNTLDLANNLEVFNNCLDSLPDLSGMDGIIFGNLKVFNNKLTF